MRKKFVLYLLIPALVLAAVVYFFIDGWVEKGIEIAGEAAMGAKVEIDHLHVTLFPVGIELRRLQVASADDPWKNTFETGTVKCAMDFGQLLRGKYIIETMEMNDLVLGTKRSTDGSLPKKKETPAPGSEATTAAAASAVLEQTARQEPPGSALESLKHGINADSLVKALDIHSLKHIDSLRSQAMAASAQWDAATKEFDASKQKLLDVEQNIRAINPSELKTPEKILAAIVTADNSLKTVNEIRGTLDQRRASVESDINNVTSSVSSIDDVAKQDFQRLLSMAKLPELNTAGIARLLVGKEMVARATKYLHYAEVGRSMMAKYSPQPADPSPPRLKGQDIRFPVERSYPKFWIKKILISGGTDRNQDPDYIYARGEARNISSDQHVTGAPLTIDLEGTTGGARSMTISALLDRRQDVPYDEYRATLTGVPLASFALGTADFLPSKIENARLNSAVKISVPGNRFDATTTMELRSLTLKFDAEPRNLVERLSRDVLSGISGFDVSFRLWNTAGPFNTALSTNLDEQIASRAKGVLGAEFTKAQDALRAKLDGVIGGKRKELESLIAGKRAEAEGKLDLVKKTVDEKLAMVEAKKKELQDRLDQEKKDKVGDALKKIFK